MLRIGTGSLFISLSLSLFPVAVGCYSMVGDGATGECQPRKHWGFFFAVLHYVYATGGVWINVVGG